MESILLIGGGGHCKSVIDSLKSTNRFNIFGILDSKDKIGKVVNGIEIIGCDDDADECFKNGCKNVFITVGSIGNTQLREKLYLDMKKIGFKFPSIIDSTAIISESVNIGEGTFIGKGVIINSDSRIGNNCILNTGCIIEHDCKIDDFVHIGPGSVLSGGVSIGLSSHIGTNSTIIQYKKIGKNTIIGAGSVVIKDIDQRKKAYGNPCREVE